MELAGKVAIVTGAAVRVGRSIALKLAEHGVRTALHFGRSESAASETAAEVRAFGVDTCTIQADLLQPLVAAKTIVGQTIAHFGQVDILINSAAIFETGSLNSTTEDQFDRHFNVNMKAPLFLSQQFAQALSPDQRGHIVNIADWRGTNPRPGHLAYTLTKHSLLAMSTVLALELAPKIQVNSVCPGAILAPVGAPAEAMNEVINEIPLARMGTPNEISQAVLFLLQSDFATGTVLHVDGGQRF